MMGAFNKNVVHPTLPTIHMENTDIPEGIDMYTGHQIISKCRENNQTVHCMLLFILTLPSLNEYVRNGENMATILFVLRMRT